MLDEDKGRERVQICCNWIEKSEGKDRVAVNWIEKSEGKVRAAVKRKGGGGSRFSFVF